MDLVTAVILIIVLFIIWKILSVVRSMLFRVIGLATTGFALYRFFIFFY